ncbi:MAG TPA: conjugal transfer protein TraF [Thermoanaerobaculia bacterium]|nr:conjugal transfer protein TraF [Thermoanaerobaculia bacterium]
MRSKGRPRLVRIPLAVPAALAAVLSALPLAAQTPSPGAKAIGMGGAFVASGNDASALWGNPAGLVECPLGCAILFGGAVATDENGFARTLRDDFRNVGLDTLTDPAKIAALEDDLVRFQEKGTGTIGSGVAGLGYAIRGFGIGIGETIYAGAYPRLVLVPVGDFVLPSFDSSVTLRGIEARELRVGYAGSFFGFTIGGDVRYVQARTYLASESLAEAADDPASLLRDALKKSERRSNKLAFDAGAIWRAPLGRIRVGIVGENLNEPELEFADGSRAPLPRAIRAGAAWAPISFDGIVLSADADLNRQKTLVPGLSSRRIAAGAQIYFLRVGAFRDLEAVDPHWAYTAGLQLPLHFVDIGLSGVYSSHKRDVGAAAEVRVKL